MCNFLLSSWAYYSTCIVCTTLRGTLLFGEKNRIKYLKKYFLCMKGLFFMESRYCVIKNISFDHMCLYMSFYFIIKYYDFYQLVNEKKCK